MRKFIRMTMLSSAWMLAMGLGVTGCAEMPADGKAVSPSTQTMIAVLKGYDALLREHVDASGLVDYPAIVSNPARLDAYVAWLATVDLETLSEDQQLATLINAYNAFTLRLIADYPDVDSIMEIPEEKRWKHARWDLAGRTVSLDSLEHEIIRVEFEEPRIHWAVVCAAISCPPLRSEAYVAEKLEAQLAEQSELVHTTEKWLRYEASSNRLLLTPLYQWYGSDFGEGEPAIVENVAPYVDGLNASDAPAIGWLDYDWSLNAQ